MAEARTGRRRQAGLVPVAPRRHQRRSRRVRRKVPDTCERCQCFAEDGSKSSGRSLPSCGWVPRSAADSALFTPRKVCDGRRLAAWTPGAAAPRQSDRVGSCSSQSTLAPCPTSSVHMAPPGHVPGRFWSMYLKQQDAGTNRNLV